MTEPVTIVDEKDSVLGTKDRELVNDNDRWRAVAIWVEDNEGNVLLAKRSHLKKYEPNLWEAGAAGTVTHPEPYETSAIRELEEELGIKAKSLTLEKVLFYKKTFGHRAMGLFRIIVDRNIKLKLQKEEVADAKWVNKKELRDDYKNNPENYVSDMGKLLDHFTS
jgi:isopentenyldiphosphate isomerase